MPIDSLRDGPEKLHDAETEQQLTVFCRYPVITASDS